MIDLFSGAGGFTLGFHRAGCTPIAGVEMDPHAARSHALNFHGALAESNPAQFEAHSQAHDITVTDPLELLRELGHEAPAHAVDVIVGGPPCPAFTRVGRAKLREVHKHPEAYKQDPRWKLYLSYLRFVEALKPVALVMENVPDLLNFGGQNLAEDICGALEDLGYLCAYTLVNSANFGVPQMRERFILIAIHKEAGVRPAFPDPTHHVVFPSGYHGTRDVALKQIRGKGLDLFGAAELRWVPIARADPGLPPLVTASEAMLDLPAILGHLDGSIRRGARRFDKSVGYAPGIDPTPYGELMREWPGFESDGLIWDHVIRSLSDRDYRLFRAMHAGCDYPGAHRLAVLLLGEELERLSLQGKAPTGQDLETLRRAYVPPYDPGKFPNKWRKMEPDEPARTLMAHLGKDSYSHIHYDSDQCRTISVREAARLQSFPDGFRFSGTMNPAFRQIGNAVPPLMAYALARSLLTSLDLDDTFEVHACPSPPPTEDQAHSAQVTG